MEEIRYFRVSDVRVYYIGIEVRAGGYEEVGLIGAWEGC